MTSTEQSEVICTALKAARHYIGEVMVNEENYQEAVEVLHQLDAAIDLSSPAPALLAACEAALTEMRNIDAYMEAQAIAEGKHGIYSPFFVEEIRQLSAAIAAARLRPEPFDFAQDAPVEGGGRRVMPTKISELLLALKKAVVIHTLMDDAHQPAIIDGKLNSTGHDLALFFSTPEKAAAYRDHYPSLRRLHVYEATVAEMEQIFGGRVEYYVVDNVPE